MQDVRKVQKGKKNCRMSRTRVSLLRPQSNALKTG